MMLWFRSFINGIGTAAGVAWPLFGIVFTLLGGLIGGTLSLVLGSISLCLFSAVALTIFYFSYREMQHTEQRFQEQLTKNERKLAVDINEYIKSIHNCYLNTQETDFKEYFKNSLHKDLEAAEDGNLHHLLTVINEHENILENKLILAQIAQTSTQQSVPVSQVFIPAFFSFVGTFGSLAGCSAGVSGLLTGLGLFSSFAAFPFLGWAVIGTAVVCGLFSAIKAAAAAKEQFRMTELNQSFKKMHKQMRAVTLEHQLEAALHQAAALLPLNEAEQECFIQKNKPFFASCYAKETNPERDSDNIMSFFYTKRSELLLYAHVFKEIPSFL